MTTFAVTDPSQTLGAINYLLSNLNQGNIGNGNVTIPGNVVVANATTGIINNYGNTSNAAPYWFRYQYINLRYGNSATGTGFNILPSNANYFGIYNSITSSPSSNPTDYTWTQVAGGFGTTKTIYYSAIGGRQVVWVAANSAPSSSFVVSTANVAIDLDVVTTAAGTPGERGPIAMAYVLTTSDPTVATNTTLTNWFSAPRDNVVAPIGTGLTPVNGDTAQFTYNNGTTNPTVTYTYNNVGSVWSVVDGQVISGNVIITGTIQGNAIRAGTITGTEIAADTITANLINVNGLVVNSVRSTNAILGDFNSPGTWIDATSGNARFGNTVSIGNNVTIGNVISSGNLAANSVSATQIVNGTITTTQIAANTITANNILTATITGNQIAAGTITANNLAANTLTANTVVSTGATLGSFSSQGFWLQGNTGNARFGNTISIGNNLIVGNNASIGGNLNITGLVNSSTLAANTVATATMIAQSVSQANSYSRVNSNVQVLSNTAVNVNTVFAPQGSSAIAFTSPATGNSVIYLSGGGELTNIFWTQTGVGTANITFTLSLVELAAPGGAITQVLGTAPLTIQSTVAGTNTYGQIINQNPLTVSFTPVSQNLAIPLNGYYYAIYLKWNYTTSSGVVISNMQAYSYNGSILGQLLKR